MVAEARDITLEELRSQLGEHGISASVSTLWRFFDRRQIIFQKKTVHAAEQGKRSFDPPGPDDLIF